MTTNRADRVLLFAVAVLLALGVVTVYSATGIQSGTSHLVSHALSLAVGAVLFGVGFLVSPERLRHLVVPLLFGAVAILIVTIASPLGVTTGGATRWLKLGPLQIQPAEFAKIALILYLAHILAKKRDRIQQFLVGFVPPVAVTAVIIALFLRQPDFGNAALVALLLAFLLFVAGTRLNYLFLSLLAVAPVAYALVTGSPYRFLRVKAFLDPWQYRHDEGYQVFQSLVSFALGGPTGVGVGAGHQKLGFVPEAHNDFIFAMIGEELGLVGTAATVLCFALIVWRGFRIARRASDPFQMFVACGITSAIGLAAAINMAVALALVPTKGLPLPFVSFGGSALVASLFGLGILMRVGIGGVRLVQRDSSQPESGAVALRLPRAQATGGE